MYNCICPKYKDYNLISIFMFYYPNAKFDSWLSSTVEIYINNCLASMFSSFLTPTPNILHGKSIAETTLSLNQQLFIESFIYTGVTQTCAPISLQLLTSSMILLRFFTYRMKVIKRIFVMELLWIDKSDNRF